MKTFGKYTYGDPLVQGDGANLIVGNFTSMAGGITIYVGHNHNTNWVTTYPFGHINNHIFNNFNGEGHPSTKGDVIIGNDVWIGWNATIMSGITIGDGAVIAANSHVVKNVEPYTLVGGNPARFIKYRFEKEQIENLLNIKWWLWDDHEINKATPLLCNKNIDQFINYALNK